MLFESKSLRRRKPCRGLLAACLPLGLAVLLCQPGQWAAAQDVGPVEPFKPPPQPLIKDRLKDSFKKFFPEGGAEGEAGPAADKKPPAPVPFQADPRRPETWGDDPKRPDRVPKKPAADPAQEQNAKRPPLLTQPPLAGAKIEDPTIDHNRPPKPIFRQDDPANPLGYADAVNQLQKVHGLISTKRITEARTALVPLRQWLIDCTEAHMNLYNALNKLPSARSQAELEKQLALEYAMLRDRAMFELGLLYIEEKEPKKAVKELVEVIRSQPRSKTGIIAYELLQEIGFTERLQLEVAPEQLQKPAAADTAPALPAPDTNEPALDTAE